MPRVLRVVGDGCVAHQHEPSSGAGEERRARSTGQRKRQAPITDLFCEQRLEERLAFLAMELMGARTKMSGGAKT
jgi:hypothetical protein